MLHPQARALLDMIEERGIPPTHTLDAVDARRLYRDRRAVLQPLPQDVAEVRDLSAEGPHGAIPMRLYRPRVADAMASGVERALPVLVYYHGGGWVIANKEVYDGGARAISKLANAVVVSVDYRQGPEHKFPAAHDDAIATYQWALANAASIKGDPKKVALAGESAGGGLAIATAIAARDMKLQQPTSIVAVYPIGGTDTTTASYQENANAKPLNRAAMSWFFKNYLNGPADYKDTRVNLVAADLKGLPPVTIINAQIDPLRTDGEMLANKIRAADGKVDQKTYDGVAHEFFGMANVIDKAKDAEQMAADALKKGW